MESLKRVFGFAISYFRAGSTEEKKAAAEELFASVLEHIQQDFDRLEDADTANSR